MNQIKIFLLSVFFGLAGCSSSEEAGTAGSNPNWSNPSTLNASAANSYPGSPVGLSAVWANDGADKVTREDTRASNGANVGSTVWSNSGINIFGAKNEVTAFNLVLEAKTQAASNVSVTFNELVGPAGVKITSAAATKDGAFDWTKRDIELFYVRYLQIKGLSRLGYEQYDERHIPSRLRRKFDSNGSGTGGWADRPDHDQYYPDIAVPMEAVGNFAVAQGQSQSVWTDIYIPKTAPAGTYTGTVTVKEGSHESFKVPVTLTVRNFALPDVPSSKTMLHVGDSDIEKRYGSEKLKLVRSRHFQMAHRHKISVIDGNTGSDGSDRPSDEWMPRLNGQLYTSANGYRGPGENVGNDVFSVGTYGSWNWQSENKSSMDNHSNNWANWFAANSPSTEYFLYLIDESSNYPQIESWSSMLTTNGGAGRNLKSFATMPLPQAVNNTPSLKIVTSTMDVGDTATWDRSVASWKSDSSKRFFMYNGKRPASGSFMIDDDGVALREVPWGQYKKGVDRWFYWESTYYTDFQGGRGDINVMQEAQTFGGPAAMNANLGMSAGNYANGDGLLFYPGTDKIFTSDSYDLDGPIASLRLKHWRRGIQDVDYLTLAARINPGKTQEIVNRMVTKVLWENGVSDPSDPSWVKCDIGWSTNPDEWEQARNELANIIEGSNLLR